MSKVPTIYKINTLGKCDINDNANVICMCKCCTKLL